MNFPVHLQYKSGKGGVEIGLKPIPENSCLEIDELFPNEIALKKKLFEERRQEVLITPSTSISIQKEVLHVLLEHLRMFHNLSLIHI